MSDTSIRTPAWGVTRADAEEVCQLSISIRTPAWGVTTPVPRLADLINFNSHPRVGGDWYKDFFGIRYSISIRTPAWGVTRAVPRTAV